MKNAVVGLLLSMLLVSLMGVPLRPSELAERGEVTERYPCENCACGCPSADYCWDRCCCHTDVEKLRWAERNRVTPPEFLVARVRNQTGTATQTACPHCTAKNVASPSSSSPDDESVGGSMVLVWKATQCRGVESFWTLLSCALITLPRVTLRCAPSLIDWSTPRDEAFIGRSDCPDPPIP